MLDALCINDNSINKNLNNQNIIKNRILKFNKNTNNNNVINNTNFNNSLNKLNPINQINNIIFNNSNILKEIDPIIERQKNIENFPELILDAPNFTDDYYLNLLDWGTKNIISVALSKSVYLYNYITQQINLLYTDINNICSVNFMNNGIVLAIGLKNGKINLFDVEKNKIIRTINNVQYNNRVSVLNWNNYILSSSGKDNVIINHDVRKKNDIINILNGHKKEVCSLKWNNNYNNYLNGDYLLSGGNDNIINLWDIKNLSKPFNSIVNIFNNNNNNINNINEIQYLNPINSFNKHKGCIKALDWCPYERNIFISGGGVNDKTLKIWNSSNGAMIKNLKVNSQICSVYFNKFEKEIITTHGYSKNEIGIWTYPKMKKITELYGHSNRVLYSCMSPDGCMLLTGSTDETLRFWKINDKNMIENKLNNKEKNNKNNIFDFMNIR
jgi:WD40 repeat protein